MNFKLTFHLDGCGVYYDPNEPIHLDALLAYALAPMQEAGEISRSDRPADIQLPLLRSKVNGHDVWHGSALFFPENSPETLRFWRKKFRQNRLHLTTGSPNLTNGVYREYNMPVPLSLIPHLYCYGSGNLKALKSLLKRNIKSLGKKRAYGYGRITDITAEEIPEDWSHIADGIAMRWLPHPDGTRLVRCAPPYWNAVDRVKCCEVGEKCTMQGLK